MYITKPVGIAFQLFGFLLFFIGLGLIPQGGGMTFFGIILTPLGVWMFWRGRRKPERQKET